MDYGENSTHHGLSILVEETGDHWIRFKVNGQEFWGYADVVELADAAALVDAFYDERSLFSIKTSFLRRESFLMISNRGRSWRFSEYAYS